MITGWIGEFASWCKRWISRDRIVDGVKKLGCWHKIWTVWNKIESEVRKFGCWCKGKADSFRNGWKRQERVKLDIEAISRILDCTDASGSTPEDHIKWIEEKIKDEGLTHFNIKVILNNYVLHNLASYPSPRITVQFEKIDFDINDLFGIEIPAYSYTEGPTGIELFFSYCNFKNSESNHLAISWLPDGNTILYFTNCKFKYIDSIIMFDLSSSSNIFMNECEAVNGETVFREGDLADIKKGFFSKSLDQKIQNTHIFKPEPRSKDHIGREELFPSITIVNSKIDSLQLIGKINSFFRNKNIFRSLNSSDFSFSSFYWGGYQKFSTSDDHIFSNRKFFLDLNKNDVIQNDAFQLLTIQKELAKCHHVILRSEGNPSWQDRVLFRFSQCVSNHGTSWLRTIMMFYFGFNLFAFLIFSVISVLVNTFHISSYNDFIQVWCHLWFNTDGLNAYGKLFNPIEFPSEIFCVEDEWWAPFLDVIHKIIYALLSYELVKTLRRFGRSNSTPPRV